MKKLIEETSSQQISFGKPGYEIKTAFADIEEKLFGEHLFS